MGLALYCGSFFIFVEGLLLELFMPC